MHNDKQIGARWTMLPTRPWTRSRKSRCARWPRRYARARTLGHLNNIKKYFNEALQQRDFGKVLVTMVTPGCADQSAAIRKMRECVNDDQRGYRP